ncbi:hypothetical protein L7F22_011872 [Adiantum nelumboides]|nr:hypothetical protein [Adiantum nelumboides]
MLCRKTIVNSGERTASSLASSLRRCAHKKALACCHCLHAQILEAGYDHNPELYERLVLAYAGCGALHDASALFKSSTHHNADDFNTLLREYARHHKDQTTNILFHQMQQEGFLPSKQAYVSILSACAAQKDVLFGKRIHSTISWSSTFDGDAVLYTALVNLYGKCGCMDESRKLFNEIKLRDVVCWTAMISIYANCGHFLEALHVFYQMQQADASPNEATFVSVLKVCVCLSYIVTGQVIHHQIYELGYEAHTTGGNALIHLYNRCRRVEDAERTFQAMLKKDVATWNAIISTYSSQSLAVEALLLVVKMLESGLTPNSVTFISVLPICGSDEMLAVGEWLHSLILDLDLESDSMICNALLAMYGKCNCMARMQESFSKMPTQDVVSWNTLISAYSQHKNCDEAFKQVRQMEYEGVFLDKVTYILILGMCTSHNTLRAGVQAHLSILNKQLKIDLVMGNALVSMYSRCGHHKHAQLVLDNMPRRDALSYGLVIDILFLQEKVNLAFQVFEQLLQEGLLPGKATYISMLSGCRTLGMQAAGRRLHAFVQGCGLGSNVIIVNALLCMYGRVGNWLDVWVVFDMTLERDRASWNIMLTSCTYHGCSHKAVCMFIQMQMEGELPDKVTFLATLSACGHAIQLKKGMSLHAYICGTNVSEDVEVKNALLGMYGKCGRVKDSKEFFDELISSNMGSMTTWNVMLSVYANQGQGVNALQIFHQMQQCGQVATPVTFVSILSVCHSGIGLAEGIIMHARLQYSGFAKVIAVENALINMYGKWGDMTAAQIVFDNMAVQDLISWTTVISNHAQHGQIPEALSHYKRMQSKGWLPNNVTLLSMLNGYSHTGLLDSCFGLVLQTGGSSVASSDHFVSIVDLLVRAGRVEEAEQLTTLLPFEPNLAMCMTLLAGYMKKMDIEHAEYVARKIFELDSENSAAHIMLSNVYLAGSG